MRFTLIVSLIAYLLFPLTDFAQKKSFSEIYQYYAARQNFNGAVMVAERGRIKYLNGAGFSNRQIGIKITPASKFRICSMTKTFTAVLVMQLYEQGKIDLKAPISRYYPEYKGAGRDQITIDNLLTYSSGLDNIDQRDDAVYALPLTPEALIDRYFSGGLVSAPGAKFSYKNADFIILGKIIEKVTGKSFAQVLQENILQPLQMKSTGYLRNGDIIKNLAASYLYNKQTHVFRNDDPYWIDNFSAAGAMYSTVADLYKFDQALFNHRMLSRQTVELMLTAHPALAYVGYGFWITPVKFGAVTARAADRQGGISGSNTTWIHLIDQNLTVIIFSNTDATDINEMRAQMVSAALGQPVRLSSKPVD